MFIKIFIITYNNKKHLDENLDSLFAATDINDYNIEVNIVNNHSHLELDDKYIGKVNILNNMLRLDEATGHLSRDYNQAIINGFEDLDNPQCDIVITTHDDIIWRRRCFSFIIKAHETYSFISAGIGDSYCSYTVDAIKSIGLWDERFCGMNCQDLDYLLRAVKYNKDKSSINNKSKRQIINELPGNFYKNYHNAGNINIIIVPDRNRERDMQFTACQEYSPICEAMLQSKYGKSSIELYRNEWTSDIINKIETKLECIIPDYIFYPYFEKNIF
jgi:hypothetical protein